MSLRASETANMRTSAFPSRFRRRLLSGFDRRFTLILAVCALLLYTAVTLLSLREPSQVLTEQQIIQVQQRYARLVLNQPVEQKTADPQITKTVQEVVDTKGAATQDEPRREAASFEQLEHRRAATQQDRAAQREVVAREVQSKGIFAAITSRSSSGTARSAAVDLIGSAALRPIEGATPGVTGVFGQRAPSSSEVLTRRESRSEAAVITRDEPQRADIGQLQISGEVKVTSTPLSMPSAQADVETERTQASIQRVVNTEIRRLRRVYEDWLKRDPEISGTLTIQFSILPSGEVTGLSVLSSTTGNDEFDNHILRYVVRWKFPPVPASETVEIQYPFVFEGFRG